MKKDIDNRLLLKYLFVIAIIFFASTSIFYIIQNKELTNLKSDTWLMRSQKTTSIDSLINALVYSLMFIILFYLYWKIVKSRDFIFKNIKQIVIFIILITILFSLIIPFVSYDVYSYIGFGAVQSEYNENPYYITINQLINKYGEEHDLVRGVAPCWRNESAVYGPLWAFICRIFTTISFGNLNVSLMVFKFFAIIVHGINCLLIWKMTKERKFVLLYGLNPLILFESISQVHNDLYIVLFVLLALYYFLNKKKLWVSILFVAMATAIKYFTVLLVPFFIIYGLSKSENVWGRIGKTILYALEFLGTLSLLYLIYARDLSIFYPLFLQQNKYCQSLILLITLTLKNVKVAKNIVKGFLIIFSIIYIYDILKMFFNKNQYNIKSLMQKYLIYLLLFIFILITNFHPWYFVWIFPIIMFLKDDDVKKIIFLSCLVEVAMFPMILIYWKGYYMGIQYCLFLYAGAIIYYLIYLRKKLKREKLKNGGKEIG